MSQSDLEQLEQEIICRLSAVDLTSVSINQPVIASTLEQYLEVLKLSPRPIIWAEHGDHAQTLAADSDLVPADEEVPLPDEPVAGKVAKRPDHVWSEAREHAALAGHSRQLDNVKAVVCWHSVLLSVPWRLYRQRLTGDRGRRTNPEYVWRQAGDALDYAARASAEYAWARVRVEKKDQQNVQNVWLPFVAAHEAGLLLFWITTEHVIALTRPAIRLNGEQLHSDRGPAVSWPDGGQQYYFLNDVHVPREIVETPAPELDPRLMLREQNAEVRREIVRKIGIERICQALGAQCLDRQGDYELLLLDLEDGRMRPYLKMKNPSVGVYHIEGVAPECRTVAEALAWRNQSNLPPTVLT
jgi:hypothetical protein